MSIHSSMRAYVVMPFASSYRALYDAGIRPAVLQAGFAVARYDDVEPSGDVSMRIAHGITTADVLIAVVTGRNANVFYEIGYAHAINKNMLVVASTRADIPAFLENLPCVVYGASLPTLRAGLTASLRAFARPDARRVLHPVLEPA